jgi:hypothetical protein
VDIYKNIITIIALAWLLSWPSSAQQLISKGNLKSVDYVFTGKDNYETKKSLTHSLAYSYSTDIGEIQSTISYPAHYQTIKTENKGFKTIVRLGPKEINGHTQLLNFDFHSVVLPELEEMSLFMLKGKEIVYVKNVADLKVEGNSLYFTFQHQRFGKDWILELRNPVWKFQYLEEEFNTSWEHICNYQMASRWLEEIKNWESDSDLESFIIKTRFLELLKEMKQLAFYEYVQNVIQQDPENLFSRMEISIFKTEKDLELLKQKIKTTSIADFTSQFVQFEYLILELQQNNNSLYGDLYHAFNPRNSAYYSSSLIHHFVEDSQQQKFELLYQKQALELINSLIEQKLTREALFQLERFETFCANSTYLAESEIFKHFKARAVYDIYLSYIQVSKQAMEHNQIDMAINYLNKASDIQQNYSSEIINNIMVEKEMRNLIKKAMARYQSLLDEGKTDSAKRVKEGILGLMKKLGLESNIYPIG